MYVTVILNSFTGQEVKQQAGVELRQAQFKLGLAKLCLSSLEFVIHIFRFSKSGMNSAIIIIF